MAMNISRFATADTFEFGSLLLKAQHTPGHTPEILAYLAFEKSRPRHRGAFLRATRSSSTRLGGPDLAGDAEAKKLAEELYETLYGFFLELDDGVIIYPAHGHGSPCGADIGGPTGEHNWLMNGNLMRSSSFRAKTSSSSLRYRPSRLSRRTTPECNKINVSGTPVLGNLPIVPAMPPTVFKEAVDRGDCALVDTRSMLGFGGGHIPAR